MNSFIAKYVLLFFITVITTDTFLFFYSNKEKDKEVHDIKILSKAIEKSLEKEDLTTVNDVLDSFEEKVIIQRDGVIYTSNFGYDSEERRDFATSQLQTYRPFWRNIDVPSEKYSQLLYYKTKEIQYFDRIINNTLYSFYIYLLKLTNINFLLLEIKKRNKKEEKLKYYLQTIRENMEQVKDDEVIEKYETEKYDKLKTKLEESKNRRLALKQELENKTLEFDKLKPEISKLKTEIQSLKMEKNKMEDSF